jgi:glycerol-3-phosphate dehydrogenase (NAD+)
VLKPEAKAISLIKGIDFDDKGVVLISDIIAKGLSLEVSVLMGANVANEVAQDQFCEATIGCRNPEHRPLYKTLFDAPTFRITVVSDTVGVELCGALKNIVAIGAGFSDGLGFGGNTKAAIIRIGLQEIMRFCKKFYTGVQDATFFESCGVADLITTCFGGRNRKCAEAFVKSGKSWEDIEKEMLNGQKLQGTLTAAEVYQVLRRTGSVAEFPFFTTVYRIAFAGEPPAKIVTLPSAAHATAPSTGAGAGAGAGKL